MTDHFDMFWRPPPPVALLWQRRDPRRRWRPTRREALLRAGQEAPQRRNRRDHANQCRFVRDGSLYEERRQACDTGVEHRVQRRRWRGRAQGGARQVSVAHGAVGDVLAARVRVVVSSSLQSRDRSQPPSGHD